MQSKAPHWFTDSAGALLLAVATAMFISNGAGAGWVPPRDPFLGISMPVVFWAVGAVESAVGLVCLFGKQAGLKAILILWLAMNFLAYQLGLCWTVGPRSFNGYWGNLAAAFHVASGMAYWTLMAVYVYLLIGGVVSLVWPLVHKSPPKTEGYIENSCIYCGGGIEFPIRGIGQRIACPHCMATVTLCEPPEKLA